MHESNILGYVNSDDILYYHKTYTPKYLAFTHLCKMSIHVDLLLL